MTMIVHKPVAAWARRIHLELAALDWDLEP
jgi:hypothetical protein